jgi:ElaB/YqjD/DUF883 family membrane-anchored ribosome-binding protein
MSKSPTTEMLHDVDKALEDVARALTRAADNLSGAAEDAVVQAVKDVRAAAETVRKRAPGVAQRVVDHAVHEVKDHPIASLAAAITAASALVGVLVATQNKSA